jgi:IS30 family transposase
MKDWHREVFELRAGGLTVLEISRKLGRAQSTIQWVLNERGERDRTRDRVQCSRRKQAGVYRPPLPERPKPSLPRVRFLEFPEPDLSPRLRIVEAGAGRVG